MQRPGGLVLLELSPRTLALLVTLREEEGWSQVATAGQILSLPGRNPMLMTFSTFVCAIKIPSEYL